MSKKREQHSPAASAGSTMLVHQILLLQQKDFRLLWRRKFSFVVECLIALIILPLLIYLYIIDDPPDPLLNEISFVKLELMHNQSFRVVGSIAKLDFENLQRLASETLLLNITLGNLNAKMNESVIEIIVDRYDLKERILDYRIRKADAPTSQIWDEDNPYSSDSYSWYEDLSLQLTFDSLFLQLANVRPLKTFEGLFIRSLPLPNNYGLNNVHSVIRYFYMGSALIALLPMVFTTRDVLAEREAGVRVYMMSMGVSPIADFFSQFISASWKISAIMWIVTFPLMLRLQTWSVKIAFLVLLWLYAEFAAAFALMSAQIFNRAVFANVFIFVACCGSIALTAYTTPPATQPFLVALNSLNPTSALMYANHHLLIYENFGLNLKFFATFPTLWTWECSALMLLIDITAVLFVCGCVDAHLLRESALGRAIANGYHKFVEKLVRLCKIGDRTDAENDGVWTTLDKKRRGPLFDNCIESDAQNDNANDADIRVENLVKRWRSGQLAVDDVSFSAKRGNITVLLGPNGAGKSTTFACLTGTVQPTTGSITVGKRNIVMDSSDYLRYVGYCPQNNPLFQNFTVYEHVLFYLRMRVGAFHVGDADEIHRVLNAVGLGDATKEYAQNLSGGMKRKLFVALALVGDSRVVLLDEPTAGMDPGARQQIRRLLAEEKQNRTILLTTHYMDEADALGDRIAIMSSGKIVCNGSSDFLKRRFGAGYVLSVTLARTPDDLRHQLPIQLARKVLSCVRRNVRYAEIAGDHGINRMKSDYEFDICLPFEEQKNFAAMFEELEARQSELNVQAFGISLSSLEQVFVKVDELASDEAETFEENLRALKAIASQLNASNRLSEHRASLRFLCQMRGLFWRNILYAWRSKFRTLTPFILAILFFLPYILPSKSAVKAVSAEQIIDASSLPSVRVPICAHTSSNSSVVKDFELYLHSILPKLKPLKLSYGTQNEFTKSLVEPYLAAPPLGIGIAANKSTHNDSSVSEYSMKNIELLYNPRLIYGQQYTLNVLTNTILYSSAKNKDGNTNARIRAGFRMIVESKNESETMPDNAMSNNFNLFADLEINIIVGIQTAVLCVLMASLVVNIIAERVNNFQHQIFLTKVYAWQYWLAQYVADYLCFLSACAFLIALSFVAYKPPLSTCIVSAIPLLLIYFFAAASLSYCFSFQFRSAAKGYAFVFCWHTIITLVARFLLYVALKYIQKRLKFVKSIVFYIESSFGLILPSINFFGGYCDLLNQCKERPINNASDFFALYAFTTQEEKGIGVEVALMLATFVGGVCVLIAVQSRQLGAFLYEKRYAKHKRLCERVLDEDEDVTEERRYMASQNDAQFALAVRKLYKFYNAKTCAVRDLTFGVGFNECFGLLGINGAGKTSTFDILTSVSYPTAGSATVYEVPLSNRPTIGYCPQFDALSANLTGRETLRLIGTLNGLKKLEWRINKVLESVKMECHADKLVKHYSGGQKRRISIGVALMSSAKLIMLDEPTAGVDPSTRRYVWNLLSELRRNGTAILLTTHSMEECEALCTKIGFMSKGSMISIGTTQHLKSKFGDSFLLTVTPRKSSSRMGALLNEKVCALFGAEPLSEAAFNAPTLSWPLPRRKLQTSKWSELYRRVDSFVEYFNNELSVEQRDADDETDYAIRDYSLVQSSMEQVFVHLANK